MKTDVVSAAAKYRQRLEQIAAMAIPPNTTEELTRLLLEIRNTAETALQWTITPPTAHGEITIASGYGLNTKWPFVSLSMQSPSVQLETSIARSLAIQLLDAAGAAESDMIVFEVFSDELGMDMAAVGNIIARIRRYRDHRLHGEEEEG